MGFESEHLKKADTSAEAKPNYANPLDWAGKNIVNPVWNSLCAEPASAIVNAINFASQKTFNTDILAKVELAEVGQEQPGSVGSYVQQIAGGLACALPYAKAGKLAGFATRGLGRAAKMEKWCTAGAKIAGNEKVAQVLGAAVYDGLKNTRGEETHFSNAMGGAASFTVYEMLNPRLKGLAKVGLGQGKLGVLSRMGAHTAGLFAIGATGSIAHEEASTFTRTGQFVDLNKAAENSVQGGMMNILLPATQHALGKAIDRVNQKMGRGTPMDRMRQELPENIQESPTVKQFIAENPLARVQRIDGKDCYVDHDRHIVYYGKEAPVSEFIHELSHLMSERDPQQKALYKSVDALDKQGKTAEADAAYISARAASEIRARQIGEQVARECGLPFENKTWTVEAICAEKLDGTSVGRTYLDHWMQERRQLQAGGKSTRAEMDYSVLVESKPAEKSLEERLLKLQEVYKASGGIFPNKAEAHADIIREMHQTIESSQTYSPQHKESLHKLLNTFVDALSDTNNLYSVSAKYRNEHKRFDCVYDDLVEHGPAHALWEISKSTLIGSRKETLLLDMAIATNGKIGDFISNPEAVQKILETIDVKQMREKREVYAKAGLLSWDINRSFAPKRAGEILESLGVGSDNKQYQKALNVLAEIMPIENANVMTDKQFQETVKRIVGNEDKGGASTENWRRVLQAITPDRIANLPEASCLELVDRISRLKEGTREEIRQLTIDEIVYGPVDALVQRVIGSGIERISSLSDKHFIDAQNGQKIREVTKHMFEYVAKLPVAQRREAQFEILHGLVKEQVLQKVNCTNDELQLLVSSLDQCSNRLRSLPQGEQADIIIDIIRELTLRNEMHDEELTNKTAFNAINAIDPETVSIIANKASDVVPILKQVLSATQKEQWIKKGFTEEKCDRIFDELSSVVRRSLRRPLASDPLIDSVFRTFSPQERIRLREALVERGDYLSVDRVFAQFQELAGALRKELKDNQQSQGINEPANTYIYAKHEPGRRDMQAINVLCQGESTVGHALAHLFRKVTGISVNIQVIGKDGTVPEGNWITFEPTDFNLKTTDGHPAEIDQHVAGLRKFGDGINFLDLYRSEALGIDKNHDIDHLYRKLDSILQPGISKAELEQRAYDRFCSQDDHAKLSVQEIESLKDALSPYDLINQDVRTIQALMFLRDKQRAKSNPLAAEDAIKYVSQYATQITYSRMFEQARDAMSRLKNAFGEKDNNKYLFVTDIDNGGSTHLTTYLFRLANGLEGEDHLFVNKQQAKDAVENARRNGQAEPIVVYVDDYTYTGTQIANLHAKDMVGIGSRTAALVLGAFDHGREAVTNSMNVQEGERKFIVGSQHSTIEQFLEKGGKALLEGRFSLPNSYCSQLVVPHLQELLNTPLRPGAMKVLVENTIGNIEKVLSAIGGSEWEKTTKNNQEKNLRRKAKNGTVDAQQLENTKDSGTEKKHVTGLILPHFVPNNAPELFDNLFVGYFGYARASSCTVFAKPYLEIKPDVASKSVDDTNSQAVEATKKKSTRKKQAVKEAALENFDRTEVKKSVGSSKGADKGPEFVTENLYRKGGVRSDATMAELKESGFKSIVDLQFEKDSTGKEGKFNERKSANEHGITYYNKGVSPTEVTVEQLQDAINTVEEARQNGPVLVHCTRGLDRTGAVIAAMRIKVDGFSLEQALDEMRAHMVTMKHPEVFEVVRDWYVGQHPESRQHILDWYERRFADDYAAKAKQPATKVAEKEAAKAKQPATKAAEKEAAKAEQQAAKAAEKEAAKAERQAVKAAEKEAAKAERLAAKAAEKEAAKAAEKEAAKAERERQLRKELQQPREIIHGVAIQGLFGAELADSFYDSSNNSRDVKIVEGEARLTISPNELILHIKDWGMKITIDKSKVKNDYVIELMENIRGGNVRLPGIWQARTVQQISWTRKSLQVETPIAKQLSTLEVAPAAEDSVNSLNKEVVPAGAPTISRAESVKEVDESRLSPAELKELLNWKKQIDKPEGILMDSGVTVQRMSENELRGDKNYDLHITKIVVYRRESGLKVTIDRAKLAKATSDSGLFLRIWENCFRRIPKFPQQIEEEFERVARAVGGS